ncbi:uncharacterized protein LOC135494932 [Lineus longissimus]|uniref:uncharacterized protein LOC135494932 n=1 Tax=Lineus longissimus TaxID=88925 RepID=UPI002B4CD5CF
MAGGKDTKKFSTNIALRESYTVRYLLERFRTKLTRHFIFSPSVFEVMRNEQLFSSESLHLIRAERNNVRRVGRLLDLLKYEGVRTFNIFLLVLRKSGHGWLAEELEQETRHAIGGGPSEDEDERESSLMGDGRSNRAVPYANRNDTEYSVRSSKDIDYVSDNPNSGDLGMTFEKGTDNRYLAYKKIKTVEPRPHLTKRRDLQIAASHQLENLMVHYDTEKKHYQKKVRSLRSEEKGLKWLLNINALKQEQARKKYDVVNVMNREMEYVTAKNFRLAHFFKNL